jgi:hypothetical protein
MNILSLGAGVQSSTLALMAAYGELPMPDCAIFSDTGWEPKAVYEHLEKLEKFLPFPVYKVFAGNIKEDSLNNTNSTGQSFAAIPWHIQNPDGSRGMGRRQCTAEYKLRPLQRKIVELLGGHPKGGANVWIGISTDEIHRMKPSRVQYIVNKYPLIEKGISRSDCLAWLEKKEWAAPKSSCIGCPFHSDNEWRNLSKQEFQEAIEIDEMIRSQSGAKGKQFMHRSLKPLSEVDFRTAEDMGQIDMFGNECEGMCGV